MTSMTRRDALSAVLALAAAPAAAQSQRYPTRFIRLLVGFAPGGAVDTVAQVLAEEMSKGLGQRIVVENRAGASGNLASGELARARPDGYTLMLGNGPQLAMNQFLMADMPVQPERDFAPVGQAASVRFVAVVKASIPAATLREFVDLTRSRPASYGSSGNGSVQHLGTEEFIAASGASLTHVPYRGSGPLINDLVAGHVDFVIDAESAVVPHLKSGAVWGLAIMAKERSPDLPDVPTIREAGYGDLVLEGWQGLVARAGTPPDVVQRLAQELRRALEQPELLERFRSMSLVPAYRDPTEFAAFIAAERERWGALVNRLGLRP